MLDQGFHWRDGSGRRGTLDTMSDMLTYQRMGTTSRNQVHALFAQTMGYVAATAALFALGAWLGRDLAVVARACFWALLALIVSGIAAIFVHIPGGALAYSALGLVIFSGSDRD